MQKKDLPKKGLTINTNKDEYSKLQIQPEPPKKQTGIQLPISNNREVDHSVNYGSPSAKSNSPTSSSNTTLNISMGNNPFSNNMIEGTQNPFTQNLTGNNSPPKQNDKKPPLHPQKKV